MKVLLDNPNSFFRKHGENFPSAFAYLLALSAIFIVLNEASIRFGFTNYVPKVGVLESVALNYLALVGGFFLLVLIFSFVNIKLGFKKSFTKSFFVLVYGGTPVFLLGWVPFAVVKAIALLWALFFIIIGINIRMKYEYRKSFFATLFIVAVVYAMILLSRNEILSIVPIQQ
jgi:hypothetical protein